jgi:hypothetical protein
MSHSFRTVLKNRFATLLRQRTSAASAMSAKAQCIHRADSTSAHTKSICKSILFTDIGIPVGRKIDY